MVWFGERKIPWRHGMTVAELLAMLDDGHLVAVVRMDGRLVSRPRFSATAVPDGAHVIPIPMIAGG